jgi:phosphonate transport system permease protein
VSYTLLRTEINVRASTIIGAVGGGGIGEAFRLAIGNNHAAKTYAIIILLLVTIVAVDQFSGWLRRRLVGKAAFEFGRGGA